MLLNKSRWYSVLQEWLYGTLHFQLDTLKMFYWWYYNSVPTVVTIPYFCSLFLTVIFTGQLTEEQRVQKAQQKAHYVCLSRCMDQQWRGPYMAAHLIGAGLAPWQWQQWVNSCRCRISVSSLYRLIKDCSIFGWWGEGAGKYKGL